MGLCYLSEVMGALLSVLLIWVVTGVLVYLAIQRVITQDYEIDGQVMLITAAVGVCFNLMSVFFCCHSSSGFHIFNQLFNSIMNIAITLNIFYYCFIMNSLLVRYDNLVIMPALMYSANEMP